MIGSNLLIMLYQHLQPSPLDTDYNEVLDSYISCPSQHKCHFLQGAHARAKGDPHSDDKDKQHVLRLTYSVPIDRLTAFR